MGEHTDYNDGFVLPVALELSTFIVGRRDPSEIRLTSAAMTGEVVVDPATGDGPTDGWGRYATAVVRALRDARLPMAGLIGRVFSDIPVAAGLSSSAAFEIALARALLVEDVDAVTVARACRRAENVYAGVASGIMDQLVCVAAEGGHACLIDCRAETFEHVPWPPQLSVLLIDSGIDRSLVATPFNRRLSECRRAAAALGIDSLRDLDPADLDDLHLDPVLVRRARHVVTENARVLDAADALRRGQADRLGALFRASHRSLSVDFDASLPAIDRLVEIAAASDGIVAARLTGAGWGGCTVNLVRSEAPEEVAREVCERYSAETGRRARWWLSAAAPGAGSLS